LEPLRSSDLRAVLEFVETAWALSGERPFAPETLAALQRLIPSDLVGYSEIDRHNRRTIEYFNSDGGEGDDGGEEELFWSIVDEHPLCRLQFAYADFSATRLSDVIAQRELVDTRVYADWFRPAGVVAQLEAGISRSRIRTRNFVFDRSQGDFSDRDRAVLDRATPHLARIHETAQLRRDAAGADASEVERLSAREEEVLELVGAGLTNAQIAERLWISPGTVKKHLDNIYDRLGVRGRAAAVARAGLKRK
jgi:DNA-binding CsgD family transcriptional regulator